VSLAVVVMLLWQRDPAVISYETPRGRQSTVTLADSSQVVLNHTTRLQVQGAGADEPRLLTLDGEAFFRVRHTGHPFVVKTVSGSVEVLGTEFNVRVRDSMLELTVLRGRVRLADGRESVVVDAGRVAVCAPGAAPVLSDRTAPAGEPGWMSGKFTFDRTSLADVCREFEVYFDIRIHLADPVLRTRTITGTVQATRADAAITTLARLTGTNVRHEESGYTLF
jgi:transmembrane sensor